MQFSLFCQKVMHIYLNLFYKGVKNNNTNEGGLQTVARKCPVSYVFMVVPLFITFIIF